MTPDEREQLRRETAVIIRSRCVACGRPIGVDVPFLDATEGGYIHEDCAWERRQREREQAEQLRARRSGPVF